LSASTTLKSHSIMPLTQPILLLSLVRDSLLSKSYAYVVTGCELFLAEESFGCLFFDGVRIFKV
jgi:hypothetical protein